MRGENHIQYNFKQAIIGTPAKRHLNGFSLACWWWPKIECWLGSFVIFQVIRTSIAKKPPLDPPMKSSENAVGEQLLEHDIMAYTVKCDLHYKGKYFIIHYSKLQV